MRYCLNFAGADAWANETALEEYIETLYPSVYDDFLGTAKAALTPELREKLRHLLNFKFKKHSRYNLPEKRLRMMERQVQRRGNRQSRQRLDRHGTIVVGSCETFHHYNVQGVK